MKTSALLQLLVLKAAFLTVTPEQTPLYKKVGDEVILEPPAPPPSDIKRVMWKQNSNIAVEWDGTAIDDYSHFKGRSFLNISTAQLTLRDLVKEMSGDYVVWINGNLLSGSIALKVISPVPKPSISSSCNPEKTRCTLTCEGSVAGLDPKPTYTWKFNATEQKAPNNVFEITPETSAPEFVCELENPVSVESSPSFGDPFDKDVPDEAGALNIKSGIVVTASLLAVVVGVALLHRVMAGMWFYQKDSMPWEADFWKKTESPASPESQPVNGDTEGNAMMETNS